MPTLEPEQVQGVAWLQQDYQRLLGDVPGLGKTAQAITAANEQGAERLMIACPAVARLNWERELLKWGWPHPIVRITEKSDHGRPHPHHPQAVIASYDGIAGSRKLRGALNAGLWDALVLDEAHRLKEPTANRTKSMYGVSCDGRNALAGKAMHRWLLSGSPMPNSVAELWTHLSALWPHLIHNMAGHTLSQEEFVERYCVVKKSQYGMKILGYKDRDGLVEILDHIMLRRDEIKGLPDLVVRDDPFLVEVEDDELTALEQHAEFAELRQVLDSAIARNEGLEGLEDEFIHLATLRRLTGVLKSGQVGELVRESIGDNDKIVVGAIHREVIEELQRALSDFAPAVIHGGVSDNQRNKEIDRFNRNEKCRVFIGQIEACKEAINLPAANRVLLVEQSWCPADNQQFIARVHRRGQTRQVFAEAVAIAGSIDETVCNVLMRKTRNVQSLLKGK